jgi:hypothetical protein
LRKGGKDWAGETPALPEKILGSAQNDNTGETHGPTEKVPPLAPALSRRGERRSKREILRSLRFLRMTKRLPLQNEKIRNLVGSAHPAFPGNDKVKGFL